MLCDTPLETLVWQFGDCAPSARLRAAADRAMTDAPGEDACDVVELCVIAQRLCALYRVPGRAVRWLRTPSSRLGGRTPGEAVAEGDTSAVLDVLFAPARSRVAV